MRWNSLIEKKFGLKINREINAKSLLEALDKISVPEGYFLREKEDMVKFLRKNFKHGDDIKVLSVGCGRGEEVYTIKYLCKTLGLKSAVVGVDISIRNLKTAKSGIYTSFSLRGMKENFLMKWGTLWRVPPHFQSDVYFLVGNLFNLPFKDKSFDAVICRNVLIYIKPQLLEEALKELKRLSGNVLLGMFDHLLLKNEKISF